MAKLTIDIPDNVVQTVLDSFVVLYGLPDGITKAQNAKNHIQQYVKDIHIQAKAKLSDEAGQLVVKQSHDAALTQADSEASTITVS